MPLYSANKEKNKPKKKKSCRAPTLISSYTSPPIFGRAKIKYANIYNYMISERADFHL